MHHFGLTSKDNADKVEKTLDKVGIVYERRHEVGYHNFYFINKVNHDSAVNLAEGVVDKSLEDGEWG